MTLTVGLIGCGGIAALHQAALRKTGVRVKWVCDLVEANAAPYAAAFGATATADYRRALADPEVQAVLVLTHSATHKTICLDAIAAGKAVICEKTLATNPDDALDIVLAAAKRGTLLYTAYMKRFLPAVQKAKELLPSLGTLFSTHVRVYQPWGDLWSVAPRDGFFHTPPGGTSDLIRRYGGGILVCGGSHILDLVGYFLGRPHRLHATLTVPEGRDYDLAAACLMETAHGPCFFEAVAHPLKRIGYLCDGWDERLELTGTRGRLEIFSPTWNEAAAKPSRLVHTDGTTGQSVEYRFAPLSPFIPELEFFFAHIARGEQGSQSRWTGYDVDELIAHIALSARLGRAVDIHWRGGPS